VAQHGGLVPFFELIGAPPLDGDISVNGVSHAIAGDATGMSRGYAPSLGDAWLTGSYVSTPPLTLTTSVDIDLTNARWGPGGEVLNAAPANASDVQQTAAQQPVRYLTVHVHLATPARSGGLRVQVLDSRSVFMLDIDAGAVASNTRTSSNITAAPAYAAAYGARLASLGSSQPQRQRGTRLVDDGTVGDTAGGSDLHLLVCMPC
jgi:hypothetical protein